MMAMENSSAQTLLESGQLNRTDNSSSDVTSFRALNIFRNPSFSLAIAFGIIGIFANAISLVAILKIRKSLTSYLRIVISLLISDLLVAFSLLAHIVSAVLLPQYKPGYGPWTPRLVSRCTYISNKAFNTMGLNVTLLTLMAMAINHYVAIIKPFQLPILLSKRRTHIMLVSVWLIAALAGFSNFFSPIGELDDYWKWREKFNYCEFIWLTTYQEEFVTFAIAVICFVAMLFIYLRIYFEVRYKSVEAIVNKGTNINKKAVVTTFFILGSFVVCWLPLFTFNVVLIIITKGGSSAETLEPIMPYLSVIEEYLFDLVLLNTLCDPLIYGIRVREVRRGFGLLFGCSGRFGSSRERSSNVSMMENNQKKSSPDKSPLSTNGTSFMNMNNQGKRNTQTCCESGNVMKTTLI